MSRPRSTTAVGAVICIPDSSDIHVIDSRHNVRPRHAGSKVEDLMARAGTERDVTRPQLDS